MPSYWTWGAGPGGYSDHFPNYTGVDGSPDAVEAAAQLGRNVSLLDLAGPLPFGDESFDGAILKDILEHVPDPVLTVKEVQRVLKPAGLCLPPPRMRSAGHGTTTPPPTLQPVDRSGCCFRIRALRSNGSGTSRCSRGPGASRS